MELDDCAFPLLAGVQTSDDANEAFGDANIALLVGARPRSKGMERKDLLEANGAIFSVQGKALSDNAAPDIRVLVVGNPANTNALIAMHNAPNIAPRAVHGHDPARPEPGQGPAGRQVRAARDRRDPHDDLGQPLGHPVPRRVPGPHRRPAGRRGHRRRHLGGEGLHPRRSSSAARPSSRPAARPARRRRPAPPSITSTTGCSAPRPDDWVSMAIPSDGAYGVPEGLISSFPVTTADGRYQVVQGLDLDEFSRTRIDASVAELGEERDAVRELGLLS